jgi:hypothetical protein
MDFKKILEQQKQQLAALRAKHGSKSASNPLASLRATWQAFLSRREASRNARCRKFGTKRSDRFGAAWSGPAKIVESVKAKLLRQHSEKNLFSARAEKVSQLQELAGIRNRVQWNTALDAWAAGCEKLDERLSKLPPSQVEVFDRSKK